MSATEDQLDRIEQKVDAITKFVTGNGSPEKGLNFRVFALEDKARGAAKVLWGGLFVVLGLALETVWMIFRSKP